MSNKVVYLTFDDGPNQESTEVILEILSKNNIKATFFLLGQQAELYPALVQKIIDNKHSIGNHGYAHLKGWTTSSKNYLNDVLKAQSILPETTLFRPPFGRLTPGQIKQVKAKGFQIVFWDVMSRDFDPDCNPEKSLQKQLKYIKNGSILVYHDNQKSSQNLQMMLPQLIEELQKTGYSFATLDC